MRSSSHHAATWQREQRDDKPTPSESIDISNANKLPQTSPEKWRFGNSIEDISRDFAEYWEAMMARHERHRVEGGSLLATTAQAIDRCLVRTSTSADEDDLRFAERISIRLKKLSLRISAEEFRNESHLFWQEGREISDDFKTHVEFRRSSPTQ